MNRLGVALNTGQIPSTKGFSHSYFLNDGFIIKKLYQLPTVLESTTWILFLHSDFRSILSQILRLVALLQIYCYYYHPSPLQPSPYCLWAIKLHRKPFPNCHRYWPALDMTKPCQTSLVFTVGPKPGWRSQPNMNSEVKTYLLNDTNQKYIYFLNERQFHKQLRLAL